jgi:hypothetical protein
MRNSNDSAVSEVVGVMLLLSVTLIIAAVVAVYATGSASEPGQPVRADLVASGVMLNENDNMYQIIFDHRSGDPFNVDRVKVSLISREDPSVHMLLENRAGEQQYIETFDPDNPTMVLLGDRFKVSIGTYVQKDAKVILPEKRGEIKCGEHLTYRFIDRNAGCPISSGEVLLREPPK